MSISTISISQPIRIETTFQSDTILAPFGGISGITELKINADIELNSDTSLVRIIMYDTLGFKYMLLESYPLITSVYDFSASNHCDETCYLNELNPDSLEIQLVNAEVYINTINYSTEGEGDLEAQQLSAKREMDEKKVDTMNLRIPELGMTWTAGDNEVVELFYDQKETLFGEGYNLLGFDYHIKGVFEFAGHGVYPKVDPDFVRYFDWRNRHGANDSFSPYWDGDTLGTGWHSPVKGQGSCGACWAFSAVGVTEAVANLYAVNHVDLDLSEQYLVSCTDAGTCDGGEPYEAMEEIASGIVTEYCGPYYYIDTICDSVMCTIPDSIITIDSLQYISEDFDSIRQQLIEHGPVTLAFLANNSGRGHAVTMSGFRIDPADSSLIWIYKDSKGQGAAPDYGFKYIKLETLVQECTKVITPVSVNNDTIARHCYDKDDDGYYFWGIGPKPDTLGSEIKEDCDDSDPNIGGFDENYNCSCLLKPDSSYQVISSDTTWSDSIYVKNVIFIDSGSSLTITGYAAFGDLAKIIVDQGAKLVVDGGYLTNACHDLWLGIEAWGSDTSQADTTAFGRVFIKNGAVIEYAKVGFANYCQLCDHYLMQSGGIIVADSATFRNNITGIRFESFRNMHFGSEYPYQSSIKKCNFITDEDMYIYAFPNAHILLKEIYGLKITSCDFSNQYGRSHEFYDKGVGILSYDGHFYLNNQCTSSSSNPCTDYDTCTFTGLEYGIKAIWNGSQRTLFIRDIFFDRNVLGVSLSGLDNATVERCKFDCRCFATDIGKTDRFLGGLFLEGCSGYTIQENTFYKNQLLGRSPPAYGLGIKNSGTEDNEVYKNYFDDLDIAVVTIGENRGRSGGLCYKCNDMTNNVNDFIVVEDDEPASGSLQGIAYYQGSLEDTVTAPAGNLFTSYEATEVGFMSGDTLEFWNYFNTGDTIRYIHHSTITSNIAPSDSNYTSETIFLTQQYELVFDSLTTCPSKIESSNNLKTIYDPRAEMNYAQEFISGYQQQLQDLVDGGDTESLNFEVLMSVPGEALDIRQQLMDESPYLSDTVMKQAIYKEYVLPNAMLRDILVANPQSAKKSEIMDYLDTRIESMPDYMFEEIYEGNDYFGAKEILESKIEYWQQIRSSAKYKLLKSYVLDSTIYHPYDSLINFYQNETDLHSKYKLALSYLEGGDMELAQSTIDQIPVDFNLSNTELNRHNDYNLMFDIIERIEDSNWSAHQFDSLSVSTLQEISSNGYSPVGSYARGLLLKGGHIEYLEQFDLPLSYKSGNSENNTTFSDPIFEDKEYLWLFPNPAKDYAIVYYEVPGKEISNSLLMVTDPHGKLLSAIPLENSKNQITLNLKGIANGNYFLSLVQDRRIIETKKMIIGR